MISVLETPESNNIYVRSLVKHRQYWTDRRDDLISMWITTNRRWCISVGEARIILPLLKRRREIDTGIFIQVQAFSGENNNPTPVCVWYWVYVLQSGEKTKTCTDDRACLPDCLCSEPLSPFISDCSPYIVDDVEAVSPGEATPLHSM